MSERVRTKEASSILGVSHHVIIKMAAQGKLPGAAKIGGTWTFDREKLRRFIREKEYECQRKISISEMVSGGSLLPYAAGSIDTAYIQAMSKLRGKPVIKESKRSRL